MATRTVAVRLTSQVQEYIAGMEQAGRATRETASEGEKLAQKRQAFQQLGTSMVAVGGAITAVGVAALKTGIEYNTLQQTSRAALKTMLGSTKEVNAQMDKLDAFAKQSPFAKSTFIQAQQQMLAFGIETKKVIPYLDAVQNAVAAAGGGNQQIAELAFIMAQIQSASKITAQDLMQFGQRGVNAAELIGSAMGMTAAEVRESITAGTLDAGKALDALAEGMATKFAGASANVKDTFEGAMDRVKAAWRDFGAELAKPLVDPEGGGMLVDFLNGLADAMRQFEKLPEPVKNTVSALTGLTGAALLAGGTILLSVPKYVELKNALKELQITAAGAKGAIAGMLPVAVALAAVPVAAKLAEWIDEMRDVTASAKELEKAFTTTSKGAEDLTHGLTGGAGLRGLGADAVIADNNLRMLNTGIGKLKAEFDNSPLGKAMSIPFLGFGREVGNAKKQIDELDSALTSMVAAGRTDEAAKSFDEFAAMATKAGWSTEDIAAALPGYTGALEEATAATTENVDALEELSGVAESAKADVNELADAIRGFGKDQFDVEQSSIKLQEAIANLSGILEAGGGSLDITTKAGRDTNKALLDVASAANDNAAAVAAMGGTTEEIQGVLEEGRRKIIDTRVALGETEAQAKKYADQLISTPEFIRTQVRANFDEVIRKGNEFAAMLRNIPSQKDVVINQVVRETGAPRGQVGAAYNEAGGMYVDGIKYFARGGIEPGTYQGGRTLYGFAEPGVPWEAFISGKPSERDRNRQIWAESGARLGVGDEIAKAVAAAVSVQSPAVYVQNPFTGQYLLSQVNQIANTAIDTYTEQTVQSVRRAGH